MIIPEPPEQRKPTKDSYRGQRITRTIKEKTLHIIQRRMTTKTRTRSLTSLRHL